MNFKIADLKQLTLNSFDVFDGGWALLSAGTPQSFNTMTVSWGGLGTLWSLPVATVYVRPQRYTFEFIEREKYFSLCFFDEKHRDALAYLGTKSGRDENKLANTDLTASFDRNSGSPLFNEARLVLICRKLYWDDLKEERFTDRSITESCYPMSDFHRVYVGEVTTALVPV